MLEDMFSDEDFTNINEYTTASMAYFVNVLGISADEFASNPSQLRHKYLPDDFFELDIVTRIKILLEGQINKIDVVDTELYKKAINEIKQREYFQQRGLCAYCGGNFKGIFKKKCTQCGKEKDY